jgi:uncharacterized membrane protein YqjE
VTLPEQDPEDRPGLFDSLRRALATLIEIAYVRLELVGLEFEATVQHWLNLLLWSALALFSASLTVLMLLLTVLIAFWDTHRLLAAGLITGLLAATALACVFIVRRRIRTHPRLLASTIAELRRDAAALREKRR